MSERGHTRLAAEGENLGDDNSARHDLELSDAGSEFDHAPANSHGLYLAGEQDGVENLEDYQEGGYHPVHLGDRLGDTQQYHVIHKLGSGGFSTVWLCRDSLCNRYAALKVHTADVSADRLWDLRLMSLDQSSPGAEYINIPKDHFSLVGPNGTHQCLVLELLGPRATSDMWIQMDNPGPVLKKFCRQTVQALNFLHKNGVCHGDFRPANILVKIANIDHLSEEAVLSLLGHPEQSEVLTESGEELPASSPKYLVPSTDLLRLGSEYLTDQICVIDFGESYQISSPPEALGIPDGYIPPEVVFEGQSAIGLACDLWALGCTLYEIRRQIPLFYMMNGEDDLLAEMVDFFGKLPEKWWDTWEARADFFNEDGTRIRAREAGNENTLESALRHKVEVHVERGGKVKKVLDISEEEVRLSKDLLMKLFTYAPEERWGTENVLLHEWLR